MYVNPFHKSKYLFIHFKKKLMLYKDEFEKNIYVKKLLHSKL